MTTENWFAFNHNEILLGTYKTRALAVSDASEYSFQTGNQTVIVYKPNLTESQKVEVIKTSKLK